MQDENIKVSIILPVYNVSEYLSTCLESLTNQTLKEIEFICINDGSTDNSLEILNKYAQNDSRFVIINQDNQGPGAARNKGISIARGECLAFVDPDDWVELNTFEILYKNYKRYNTDLIMFNYEENREDCNKANRIIKLRKIWASALNFKVSDRSIFNWKDFNNIQFSSFILSVWNRLYSTDFVKTNNIQFANSKSGEDSIFSLKSMILAKNILYIEQTLYHYRMRIGSIVNKASDDNFCVFKNVELFKQFLQEQNLLEKYKKEYEEYSLISYNWHYELIPSESIDKYKAMVKEQLSPQSYDKFIKNTKLHCSFIQKIFSIKNIKRNGKKRKNIWILGMNFII